MAGLIMAASKAEILPIFKALRRNDQWKVVITGIGGSITAYAIAKAIQKYKPAIMLQAGIAGSFDEQILLGDVVTIGSDCFGDLGVVEHKNRKSIFDLTLAAPDQKPFKKGKLINPHKRLLKVVPFAVVNGVSVNEVTTSKADIQYYKKKMNASIESMEGAAFHYVALMEKIPFLQIRSISNYVGERNKKKWSMPLAINNLNTEVLYFINHFKFPVREIKGSL